MRNGRLILVGVILALAMLACNAPGVGGELSEEALNEAMTAVSGTATAEAGETEGGSETDEAPDEIAEAPTATATAIPAEGDCAIDAAYVADLNIPDGSLMEPGQTFDKSWRLKNSGCATWSAGTQVYFVSGHQINGPGSIVLQTAVDPGAEVDITLTFTAPNEPGSYLANYQLRTQGGEAFGPIFYVSIIVPLEEDDGGGGGIPQGPGGIQANPTNTPSGPIVVVPPVIQGNPTATPKNPDQIQNPQNCTYSFALIEHVTPNGINVFSGQFFEKSWKFANTGTCTWPSGTQFYFVSGDQMSAPSSGNLTAAQLVAPGQTFIFKLTGYGPQTKGYRSGTWGFRDDKGVPFGIKFTMEVNVQ